MCKVVRIPSLIYFILMKGMHLCEAICFFNIKKGFSCFVNSSCLLGDILPEGDQTLSFGRRDLCHHAVRLPPIYKCPSQGKRVGWRKETPQLTTIC